MTAGFWRNYVPPRGVVISARVFVESPRRGNVKLESESWIRTCEKWNTYNAGSRLSRVRWQFIARRFIKRDKLRGRRDDESRDAWFPGGARGDDS
jgi:hypothetical protein